jgi:hypothetical protein
MIPLNLIVSLEAILPLLVPSSFRSPRGFQAWLRLRAACLVVTLPSSLVVSSVFFVGVHLMVDSIGGRRRHCQFKQPVYLEVEMLVSLLCFNIPGVVVTAVLTVEMFEPLLRDEALALVKIFGMGLSILSSVVAVVRETLK